MKVQTTRGWGSTLRGAAALGAVVVGLGMWASLAAGAFLRPGVTPNGKSSTPALVTDAKGRVYLVWVDARKGSPGLFFNRSDDGGSTWREDREIFLAPSPEGRVYEPEVRADGQGTVYAVWRLRHVGDEIWFAASRDFGATWKPAARINSRGTGFLPHLSADGSGRVYVVWYEELGRAKQYAVHFNASWDRGATWFPRDIRLDPDHPPGTAALPQLASDDAGHVYVVWREGREGPQEVMFTASDDAGKTWSRPVKLSQSNTHTEHPRIATDGTGHVYVLWRDWRHGGQPDLFFTASSDHGKSWQAQAVRLNSNPPGSAETYGAELYATRQGRVYVTWMDRRNNGQPDVFFAASADQGRTWQGNIHLSKSPGKNLHARLPRLAADDAGRVWILWEEHGSAPRLFYSASSDSGNTWLLQEMGIRPFDAARGMHSPSLGMLPDGKLAVAWEERGRAQSIPEAMDPARLPSDVTIRVLAVP